MSFVIVYGVVTLVIVGAGVALGVFIWSSVELLKLLTKEWS